jgi:predicted DNA-binding transcriptional regulator AlpA
VKELDPLLLPPEVAEMLRVSVKTLANWRNWKTGPAYKKFGNRIFYRQSDIKDWERKRTY